MPEGRRRFLGALSASALGLGGVTRAAAAAGRAERAAQGEERPAGRRPHGGYGLAYTSFAVRLQRGRDLIRGAGRPSLPAETFLDLCRAHGADGCQMDLQQLDSTEPAYLDGLKRRIEEGRLFVELSVGGKIFEDELYFADVARAARALGATRLRVALLHGRRYEDFRTLDAWRGFADHWRGLLPRAKGALERHRLEVGIENHKDWTADELVALIQSVDSPWLGACVDFGNNVALLEDPLDTAARLAPYAVTTHLKDMAVRRHQRGFELSEVPLGTGICPLAKMVALLRAARPQVPLCLEMITRDPLEVPYLEDGYWASFGGRDAARVAAFESAVLARASDAPLPRISGLSYDEKQEREDENVQRSTAFARASLLG